MKNKQFWIRFSGLLGILGGIVLFAGDMLFYYDSVSANLIENMAKASDFRIVASGITALIATWLYLAGLIQIYFALRPVKSLCRNLILACFTAIFTAYGIVHGAYVAIATSAKLAVIHNLELKQSVDLAIQANQTLRFVVYPIFALLSVFFITQILKKKTLYPRWIVFFYPLLPFLGQFVICQHLKGSVKLIICGGYLNLLLIVFFTASTIALWRKAY